MADKFRWGIISTGKIAHALADAIQSSADGEVVAVGSRAQTTADAFAAKYNIPRAYDSYEALCADPEVDIVYVATPHSHHYDNVLMALNENKHVLNEKAFTINARQAEECIDLARERGLFLMEAMWMRFNPHFVQARQWLEAGLIGDIQQVFADLSVHFPFDPTNRFYNPELGGGALLDLGIYPISFAHAWLGVPDDVYSVAFLGETGVDEHAAALFAYESGKTAQLSFSMRVRGTCEAVLVGDKGVVRFAAPIHSSRRVTLSRKGEDDVVVTFPEGNFYRYEVEEVHRCLKAGLTESPIMPLDDSLALMRIMDAMREEWGVEYPME